MNLFKECRPCEGTGKLVLAELTEDEAEEQGYEVLATIDDGEPIVYCKSCDGMVLIESDQKHLDLERPRI